jgi:hypothetical protein
MTPFQIAEFYAQPVNRRLTDPELVGAWLRYRNTDNYESLRLLGKELAISATTLARRLKARYGPAYTEVALRRAIIAWPLSSPDMITAACNAMTQREQLYLVQPLARHRQ